MTQHRPRLAQLNVTYVDDATDTYSAAAYRVHGGHLHVRPLGRAAPDPMPLALIHTWTAVLHPQGPAAAQCEPTTAHSVTGSWPGAAS